MTQDRRQASFEIRVGAAEAARDRNRDARGARALLPDRSLRAFGSDIRWRYPADRSALSVRTGRRLRSRLRSRRVKPFVLERADTIRWVRQCLRRPLAQGTPTR